MVNTADRARIVQRLHRQRSIGRSKPTPPSRCRARRAGRPPLPAEPARQPSTSRL
jgi:hypothetical protein